MDTGTGFQISHLLGPMGGELAIAFGAGCAAGYAFCLRTVYKMLKANCDAHIESLQKENTAVRHRLAIAEDRLYQGTSRQMAQIRESEVRVLGANKLGQPPLPEDDK